METREMSASPVSPSLRVFFILGLIFQFWRCSSIGSQSVGLVNRSIRVRLPSSPPKDGHGDTETRGHGDTGTRRHGDTETRRHGDTETRRHGDTETRRHGGTRRHGDTCDPLSVSPSLSFPMSPCPRVTLSPCQSCGVAKLVRHWIVNPVIVGSSPTATAKSMVICR